MLLVQAVDDSAGSLWLSHVRCVLLCEAQVQSIALDAARGAK